MSYAKDVLVETDWVAEHLDDDSIRIVEVDENPALYAEAHIPGAIGFDWRVDLQDQVKRDFLGPEDFGALMGSRGISNDHTVVLYGDRNNWFAAYTYWYFRYYGHDRVKLVNGPREKWIADARDQPTPTSTAPLARRQLDPRLPRRGTAALDSSTNLVDVRSPQEYSGELIAMPGYEQEGAQRAGHIPAPPRCPGRRRSTRTAPSSRPTSCATCTRRRACIRRRRRSSPTAGSASARPTPGSSCTSCSARMTSRTTTGPGPSGAIWSACRIERSDV